VPRPGYPLLDMIGDLAAVRRVPYPLEFDGGWHLEPAGLHEALALEPRARAVVVVAPSNPTGHVPSAAEWTVLRAAAAGRGLPLVVDEVFADYPLRSRLDAHFGGPRFTDEPDVPWVVLSGLSKVAALPQLKLSWAVLH